MSDDVVTAGGAGAAASSGAAASGGSGAAGGTAGGSGAAGGAAGGAAASVGTAGGETPELAFVQVTDPEHIAELANFADGIFREHFSKLHSPEKVDYLCHYLLGTGTLISAIADEGYEYYFADIAGSGSGEGSGEGDPAHAGFVGIKAYEDHLFLSKLYLASEWRGKGLGRAEFEFVKGRARELGLPKIRLTCARDNRSSIAAYHHFGCEIVGESDTEVGDGIEMNDYIIEYVL